MKDTSPGEGFQAGIGNSMFTELRKKKGNEVLFSCMGNWKRLKSI